MNESIARQLDREAELEMVALSRGQADRCSVLITIAAVEAAWQQLGQDFWPEIGYWNRTRSLLERGVS